MVSVCGINQIFILCIYKVYTNIKISIFKALLDKIFQETFKSACTLEKLAFTISYKQKYFLILYILFTIQAKYKDYIKTS